MIMPTIQLGPPSLTNLVAAVISGKSLLARMLAIRPRALEAQLCIYRLRITALFFQQPAYACFGSLPGAGEKLAPRLLAELASCREVFISADTLRAYAGTAPVTNKSGKSTSWIFDGLAIVICAQPFTSGRIFLDIVGPTEQKARRNHDIVTAVTKFNSTTRTIIDGQCFDGYAH